LLVTSRKLHTNRFVAFFSGAVCLAVGAVVYVAGDLLSKTVALFAELSSFAVDLFWVLAVCTLASVHLEVVTGPALGAAGRSRERADWVAHETH
jgi:hypothetical protein